MWQLVSGVDLLHRNKMIHTDLKLENVLLKNDLIDRDGYSLRTRLRSLDIRLIDFGSLDSGSAWHHHLVTTRHYRAPEILMGLRWGYECDIWSLGCILCELTVGTIDFDSRDAIEHLFLIQHMIGRIPRKMWNECTREELLAVAKDGYINVDLLPRAFRDNLKRKPLLSQILSENRDIAELALSMLKPNPDERPTTDQIMRHRLFWSFYNREP
jgi:dual-specificity kinase